MIPILCNVCDQHVLWLDPLKLAWPLDFSMFTPLEANNRLPSGPVGTDLHCPICTGPPLHWDAGTGVIGQWLKIRGGDGKPTLIKTAELIEKWKGIPRPRPVEMLPIPTKKHIQRAANTLNDIGPKRRTNRKAQAKPNPTGKTFKKQRQPRAIPTEVKEIMAQVQQGQSEEPAAVTKDEILATRHETERERSALARRTANLRPTEGYQAPK